MGKIKDFINLNTLFEDFTSIMICARMHKDTEGDFLFWEIDIPHFPNTLDKLDTGDIPVITCRCLNWELFNDPKLKCDVRLSVYDKLFFTNKIPQWANTVFSNFIKLDVIENCIYVYSNRKRIQIQKIELETRFNYVHIDIYPKENK